MKMDNRLVFLPLGGAEEIGMNLNLYGFEGKWLMVDLGVSFGEDRLPGGSPEAELRALLLAGLERRGRFAYLPRRLPYGLGGESPGGFHTLACPTLFA